ncbi:energy transducer TonB family protein [Methylobacterium sp. Gmos1]
MIKRAMQAALFLAAMAGSARAEAPLTAQDRRAFAGYVRTIRSIIVDKIRRDRFHPREFGVVVVSCTILRSGLVTRSRIVQSSGSQGVDWVANLVMPPRGFRLPPFPPSIARSSVEVTIPIRFHN